jgi:hypothetical protein
VPPLRGVEQLEHEARWIAAQRRDAAGDLERFVGAVQRREGEFLAIPLAGVGRAAGQGRERPQPGEQRVEALAEGVPAADAEDGLGTGIERGDGEFRRDDDDGGGERAEDLGGGGPVAREGEAEARLGYGRAGRGAGWGAGCGSSGFTGFWMEVWRTEKLVGWLRSRLAPAGSSTSASRVWAPRYTADNCVCRAPGPSIAAGCPSR